ncbi:hypothetical protein [Chitinophaga sp. Cy-1792]|uniref:hypothetical protein n=1 Tax=Chitinophaga sp. Cy-1792 TaxID=2608339 RepID=UPI0014214CF2|nr:hypothetical protein [Chitinophaga sp. Cy-1792]NIG53814.1 hypothetical protein [Chitinophaga sp. Cy-1792]
MKRLFILLLLILGHLAIYLHVQAKKEVRRTAKEEKNVADRTYNTLNNISLDRSPTVQSEQHSDVVAYPALSY